jgi:hypothetical protein
MAVYNADKRFKNYQRVPDYKADYDSIHKKPSAGLAEVEFLWHEVGYDIHSDHFGGSNGIHVDRGQTVDALAGPLPQGGFAVLNDYWEVSTNMIYEGQQQ